MKKSLFTIILALASFVHAQSQDIMLQGWYWDYPKTGNGKWWVDTIAQRAHKLSDAGYNSIWIPPMSLAGNGGYSNGYDIYDLFNLGGTYGSNTAFGNRMRIDKMMDSLALYNITPIADMIYNHRANGKLQNNDAVEGWIENYNLTKHNNGESCYPSDRFKCILPIGGTTDLDSGIYYFKIHSASGSTDYYNKPYTVYIYSKKKGWANLPDLTETANNGGGDCGELNDNISLGRNMKAKVDAGGCGTDEFELTITGADYFHESDTLFISITNDDGNYADHFIYGIWYSGNSADVQSQLRYQTYTNFSATPSQRGDMSYLNFKPNGNPTCLCGDWDAMLFYNDLDQYYPATIDTLQVWTKWMMEDVGVKGLRLDAVKNFTPEFTGNLLDYLHDQNDNPEIIVGESYDYDASALKTRLEAVYSYMDQDTKDAMYFSLFDFNLQASIRDACDAFGYDARNIFASGMHGSQQIYRKNIVTFVNNHDFREEPQSTDADPVLGYAYILTNPTVGIPCVYWSDYYDSDHPTYTSDINKLMRTHYNFIQGAQDADYLTRFNTPYAASYFSGGASTSLIYQLSNMTSTCLPGRDVVVAINFSGSPLKVDIALNTGSPYHLHTGDTLVDVLSRSNFPYAIVSGSSQVYIDLPARSYSVWVRVSPITQSPVVNASGATSFCNGGQVTLTATTNNACHSYQWKKNNAVIDGATTHSYVATASGLYQLEESYNGAMAHASNTVTVTVSPEHPEISTDGITMSCSVSNVSYQWLFGNTVTTLSPISGATAQQYTPQQSGIFTVVITDLTNCKDTAGILSFWMVGIPDPLLSNAVTIFPNPASELLSYRLQLDGCRQVEIYDVVGKIIATEIPPSFSPGSLHTLNLQHFSAGI
ncbi:MAG: alpha-amylase family glycosyl hydrolase, partial [Chitinophagales bacterium]